MGIKSARRRLSGLHTVWGEGRFISGPRPSEDVVVDAAPVEAHTAAPAPAKKAAKKAASTAKKTAAKKAAPAKAAAKKTAATKK